MTTCSWRTAGALPGRARADGRIGEDAAVGEQLVEGAGVAAGERGIDIGAPAQLHRRGEEGLGRGGRQAVDGHRLLEGGPALLGPGPEQHGGHAEPGREIAGPGPELGMGVHVEGGLLVAVEVEDDRGTGGQLQQDQP